MKKAEPTSNLTELKPSDKQAIRKITKALSASHERIDHLYCIVVVDGACTVLSTMNGQEQAFYLEWGKQRIFHPHLREMKA